VIRVGAEEDLLFHRDGPLAFITVNRPAQRNAFTFAMYRRLAQLCDAVAADDGVRVVILRGAGGQALASGTDIRQFLDFRTPRDALDYEAMLTDSISRLADLPRPTIAQIEGAAVGGGLALALACDLRYCTPDSRFGAPPARLGNIYAPANIQRLMDQVGPMRAKEMLFTGRLVEAEEALRMGLVTAVVPRAELDRHVRGVAEGIAANAPITLRESKRLIQRLLAARVPDWRGEEHVLACYMSEDFREGVRAFLEKRAPRWQGR
jgi:enoyl-CoA hydratase